MPKQSSAAIITLLIALIRAVCTLYLYQLQPSPLVGVINCIKKIWRISYRKEFEVFEELSEFYMDFEVI